MKNLIPLIKKIDWENRVSRTGFLQSKDICNEAETEKIKLTDSVSIKYKNIFWVNNFNLYDNKQTLKFETDFEKAFLQNKNWTERIIDDLDETTIKTNNYLQKLNRKWENGRKSFLIRLFLEYVALLKRVQKYYFVVPLTSYCENKIIDKKLLAKVSFPYKKLEIESIGQSSNIIKDFAWIKTAYNIIEELTPHDLNYLKPNKPKEKKLLVPKDQKYLIKALQIAIYARNRIKELSQKLWYYSNPLLIEIASNLNLSRDEFLCLTHDEVIKCLRLKKLIVPRKEVKRRTRCFAVGIINNKKYVLSGKEAKNLVKYFDKREITADIIKGNVAFPGKIKGIAKVIMGKDDFCRLNDHDILVAPMTTPDYVILMKKAAAIVTDEGGLSCHAAIVSRELKTPCIIGTKIATKVLKDGDRVEVDANHGVVRKI